MLTQWRVHSPSTNVARVRVQTRRYLWAEFAGALLRVPFLESPENLFGPEKPFEKLRPAYSVKLVFSYVVKGIKIKITAKFRASRRLRFEDTKKIRSPEYTSEKFRDFRETGPFSERFFSGYVGFFLPPKSNI